MKVIYLLAISVLCSILPATAQRIKPGDGILLKQMSEAVTQNKYPGIHSILISRGDNLVYEQYFNHYTADSLHDSRSSFKSITALLVAIALDKGLIKSTAEKVYDFFPNYTSFKNDSPLKKAITIQNLLDMESGFDCEEFNDGKNCEDEMSLSKDWVKFSLDLPMKDAPGTVWAYTSCNPMILSGLISRVAHTSVMDFAQKNLFGPLQITNYRWTIDPSGNAMTGGSFYIRPADMLKIGQMVRNGGMWNGKQIISKKRINAFIVPHIPIPGFSFVKSSRSTLAIPQPTFYGNYWYAEQLKTAHLKEDVLFASGNGGQYIFIIKRLRLVVVFTQGNYGSWKAKQAFDLLARYIVPSFKQ